ncbi:MAG: hypothetical protein ACK4ST_05855, partial [Elioraea tepidiphila]
MIGLFAIWEASVHLFGIREFILPAPSAIWSATIAIWSTVLDHTLATLTTVLLGFGASVLISLPLAMLIAASPVISAAIYPLLVVTQSIPPGSVVEGNPARVIQPMDAVRRKMSPRRVDVALQQVLKDFARV